MNAVHKRLDYLDSTLAELQEKVGHHAMELASHNERLSGLEKRMGPIEAFISEMAEKALTEKDPIPRLPDLRPGVLIPDFDPRLPVTPPETVVDPMPIETIREPTLQIDINKEEKLPQSIVQELRPRISILDLEPLININKKENNGDNNI